VADGVDEAVTVTATRDARAVEAIVEERREATGVVDGVSGEQMSQSGDSDSGGALKRVTGVTLVGGRYVYVRGLGERYSSTLLDGALIPSPEPERRVVPLDLFPTKMLDSILVQKSYSPEFPGEFGGGAVVLRTRAVPDAPVASFSLSGALRPGSTFQKGAFGQPGPDDGFGWGSRSRALPASVREASDAQPLAERDLFSDRGYTAEELEQLGEAMPDRWNTARRVVPPGFGLGTLLGWGRRAGERAGGFLFGLQYGQDWALERWDTTYYALGADSEMEPAHEYAFESLTRDVRLSSILVAGFQPHATQRFSSTTLLARRSDDETRSYSGYNRDLDGELRVTRLRWVERTTISQRFSGHHEIPPLSRLALDWHWTPSWAFREEPDRREYRYDLDAGTATWLLSDRPEGNERFFSSLAESGHDLGLDLSLPFLQWASLPARARVGVAFTTRSREVDTRRFKFMQKGELSRDPAVRALDAESIFAPEHIGAEGFQFEEITRQTDNYRAQQRVSAVYGVLDLPLFPWLALHGGARVERSVQDVTTYELFNPEQEPVEASLASTDVLPAGGLTLTLRRGMQIRAGYGATLARPEFRELSPATFNDVTGGRQTYGNPELDRARIHHVDLRWELYGTGADSASVAGFWKRFVRPIETVVVVSAQHSVTWENAAGADNLGAEIDGRKDFGFAHPALRALWLGGNVSFVWSRVRLDGSSGIQTSERRPLQGQSPFVVNVQAGWDSERSGTDAVLSFHVFGRRIEEVGALGAPDVYEEPLPHLDFSVSQRIPGGFRLKFNARNLLDPWAGRTQGGQLVERRKEGLSLGLELSWDAEHAPPPLPRVERRRGPGPRDLQAEAP
jgi:outer membrane receptor protein involved in Fe transport